MTATTISQNAIDPFLVANATAVLHEASTRKGVSMKYGHNFLGLTRSELKAACQWLVKNSKARYVVHGSFVLLVPIDWVEEQG